MSVKVCTLVWNLNCHHGMKLVLLKLADCANDNGENVFPFVATVARDCGCTDRTVQRVIKYGKDRGWIEDDTPINRANRYRFNLAQLRADAREDTRVTNCHPGDSEGDNLSLEGRQKVTPRVTECHLYNNRHITTKEEAQNSLSGRDLFETFTTQACFLGGNDSAQIESLEEIMGDYSWLDPKLLLAEAKKCRDHHAAKHQGAMNIVAPAKFREWLDRGKDRLKSENVERVAPTFRPTIESNDAEFPDMSPEEFEAFRKEKRAKLLQEETA